MHQTIYDNSRKRNMSLRIVIIAVCVLIVVALLGSYAARGWVRKTVFPAIAQPFARHSIGAAMRDSKVSLQAAGVIAKADTNARQKMTCSLDWAERLYISAVCEAYATADLAAGAQSTNGLRQAVARLKYSGWAISEFDTSDDLVQVYALKDYGPVHCSFSLAASPTIGCYRQISIF
jgi:multisubunit Na+/H+ antiporter MnhG subunit